MESVQGITLARAISVSPAKMEKILAGEEEPNARLIAKIAAYFFIPVDIITDDAKEVAEGFECGIGLENWQDLQIGDILEIVETEEIRRKLEINE